MKHFLYRDQKVTQQIIDQYEVGDVLREPAYVDSSKFRSRILDECNLRYLIASSAGADLSLVNNNAKKFGLVVFPRGSLWTVFDKYRIGELTQLLISSDITSERVVEAARRDFEELYEAPLAENLNKDEWRNRLFFPIGLTNEGIPYPR